MNQALKTRTLQSVPAPSGVAIDSNGNMYVASFSNNEIYKINKDGKSVYADEKKGVGGPIGLAIDSNNNIYVANYNKGNILLIKPNGETSVLLTAKQPYCIIVDEAKNKIYVTEQQTNSILSHDISDILIKKANENPVPAVNKEPEKKVFTYPVKDKNPLGVPSIQEAPYTKGDARSSITAPIMVPSEGLFD